MSARKEITDLQRRQLRHDEGYHQDILVLDTARRAKHMTFHNAKYSGRFIAAMEDGDDHLFLRTLTDAFIISLATANIFAQDLAAELNADSPSLTELGTKLIDVSSGQASFVRTYASLAGKMAKACESLDHLEDFPFRATLTVCNAAIIKALLVEASIRQIDIRAAYAARIAEVEAASPRRLFQ